MRLFLAIPIPQIISHKLQLLVRKNKLNWETVVDGHLVFVASKKYHITLKFCGEIDDSKLPDIIHMIQDIVAEYRAIQIETTAITAIPYHRPRIIGLDIRQNTTFNHFQKHISEHLDMSGLLDKTVAGTKPLHLTLARIKGNLQADAIAPIPFHEILMVDSIILYKSILKDDGPQYTPLETFTL